MRQKSNKLYLQQFKQRGWLITGRNEVVAKVMFLQACVCPQGGGVSASVHAGIPPPTRQTPQEQTPPQTRCHPTPQPPPPDQAEPPRPGTPPGSRYPPGPGRPPRPNRPPSGSRLQQTVYERPERILLECILVEYEIYDIHFALLKFEYRITILQKRQFSD